MNDNHIHRRIDRAYVRMLAAKSKIWERRWADAFLANVRARNAQRSAEEVRELERDLGLC